MIKIIILLCISLNISVLGEYLKFPRSKDATEAVKKSYLTVFGKLIKVQNIAFIANKKVISDSSQTIIFDKDNPLYGTDMAIGTIKVTQLVHPYFERLKIQKGSEILILINSQIKPNQSLTGYEVDYSNISTEARNGEERLWVFNYSKTQTPASDNFIEEHISESYKIKTPRITELMKLPKYKNIIIYKPDPPTLNELIQKDLKETNKPQLEKE